MLCAKSKQKKGFVTPFTNTIYSVFLFLPYLRKLQLAPYYKSHCFIDRLMRSFNKLLITHSAVKPMLYGGSQSFTEEILIAAGERRRHIRQHTSADTCRYRPDPLDKCIMKTVLTVCCEKLFIKRTVFIKIFKQIIEKPYHIVSDDPVLFPRNS